MSMLLLCILKGRYRGGGWFGEQKANMVRGDCVVRGSAVQTGEVRRAGHATVKQCKATDTGPHRRIGGNRPCGMCIATDTGQHRHIGGNPDRMECV